MGLENFDSERLKNSTNFELSDALEEGNIIYFPVSPVILPSDQDLEFFRSELPNLIKSKNISYHPGSDRVRGIDSEDKELSGRVYKVLTAVSSNIDSFLSSVIPGLRENWTVGTCSFRPIQEKGRDLKPHASNELVHIDAGAYGATDGDRILRFFINVNPQQDRVWATKGNLHELYDRYGKAADIKPENAAENHLLKGPLDHFRTWLLKGLKKVGLREANLLDSSPYDRKMRKFHNYMKDTPSFQNDTEGHEEIRFAPFSAWMVFTDMVSHASLSGQYAFVFTCIIRRENCRKPEHTPYNILQQP